jgi:transcriptional regulator with XRE-family HTH domain
MTNPRPVRRRLIGTLLRGYRERLGYGLGDAARVLDCDRSKISRIESGERGIRRKDLRELLAEYGADEHVQLAVLALAQEHTCLQEYFEDADHAGRELVSLELAATEVPVYSQHMVPDLLQTQRYALAAAEARSGTEAAGSLAELTLARQQLLAEDKRPQLSAVLDEAVLHRMVGGLDVMRAQLQRLAEAHQAFPAARIQVLPFTAGSAAANCAGSATIWRFTDTPGVGAVYLPTMDCRGTFLVDQADVARYEKVFAHLTTTALTPAESEHLIRQLAEG